jgi:GNAT superfamily N-acetyltransferase
MTETVSIKRTTAGDPDFHHLIRQLDHELWHELKEDQATYEGFNKVDHVNTVVLVYDGDTAAACGCFKEFDRQTVEIKRMFVQKKYRGKGWSKMLLQELEDWAVEKNYSSAVLETSIRFQAARGLYERMGYFTIPNYPPYTGLEDSVCMKKNLQGKHQASGQP